jgi:hypothetical protein
MLLKFIDDLPDYDSGASRNEMVAAANEGESPTL